MKAVVRKCTSGVQVHAQWCTYRMLWTLYVVWILVHGAALFYCWLQNLDYWRMTLVSYYDSSAVYDII